MSDLWSSPYAPMGARRNDPVVGKTEWGGPIYQTAFGHRYWAELPPAKTKRQTIGEMLYPGGVRSLEKAPNYSLKTTREVGYDGPGMPTVSDAAKAIWGMIEPGMTAPGRALKGEPVTNMDVVNTALDWGLMTAPATAPAGALRAGGIRAYHGSPHDFDRFDMSKIGTGEGAQAYGHGLYFAEAEDVAKGYRDALAPGMGDGALRAVGVSDGDLRSMRQFTQSSVDPDVALRDWLGWTGKRETPELRDAFMREWNGRNQGHMYEVNINADPNDFLDWDAPLSEQPQKIRDALGPRLEQFKAAGAKFGDDPSGEFLWRLSHPQVGIDDSVNMSRGLPEQATGRLREAGIPGIKYKDAGSRGAEGGTRNYVVFDDKLISILRKYGLLPAAMAGGMYSQSGEASAAQ